MKAVNRNWPQVHLRDVCELHYGKSLPNSKRNGGHVPVYGSNGIVGYHDEAITNGPTIIVGRKGSLGEVAYCPTGCWPIDTTYYIDSSSTKADLSWLTYCLRQLKLTEMNKAAAIPGLNRDDAYARKFLLPPLEEQKQIAAILDKADAVRRKRAEGIRMMDEFLKAAFLDMFGDPLANLKGWDTATIDDVILEGPQNGLYRPSSDYGTGIPILRIDAFYDGEVTDLSTFKRVRIDDATQQKYAIREGDIVINRVNSRKFLGKSAIIPALPEPMVFESNMMRFRVDTSIVDPVYFVAMMQHNFIKRQILNRSRDAVNQSSINQDDVKSIEIKVPPKHLQEYYGKLRIALHGLRQQQQWHFSESGDLFNSLAQRAFRGDL